MESVLKEDAHILIPNPAHQNFTRTHEVIPKGTKVNGEHKIVKGLYRGQPFEYNLFYTDKGEIIYIKHIKPKEMQKTEVTLGADSQKTATKVDLPNVSNLGKRPVIGIIAGGLLGYGIAKYHKVEGKKVYIYAAVGAVLGFVAGKYLQSRTPVKIVPSK